MGGKGEVASREQEGGELVFTRGVDDRLGGDGESTGCVNEGLGILVLCRSRNDDLSGRYAREG